MVISYAQEADIPELCVLLDHLFAQEAEFSPNPQTQGRGLAAILRQPHIGRILVAREGERLVGMVNLLFTISTALGGRVALLEDMVVAPDARGTGVGSVLLRQAAEVARQEGCLRMTLLTDGDNRAAQRFYARHGFRLSAMVPMRLMLIRDER